MSINEISGIFSGAVKCVEIKKTTESESMILVNSDTEKRKLGERVGLDTPIVLAVNFGYYIPTY